MPYSAKNKIPKIVMPICDDTLFCLKMSSFLFDKYWPKETKIDVIGFAKPDFKISKKMNFISISDKQENGAKGWSKYILKYIRSLKDKQIILTLEDFFPTREPNLLLLNKVKDLLQNNEKVGRFDLTFDSYSFGNFSTVKTFNNLTLIKKERYSEYRVSTQPSLWNVSFLTRILQNTTSPWDFEVNGSRISNNLDYDVFAFGDKTYKNFPTYWIHKGAVSRQYPNKINVLGIDPQTIKEMVDLKLIDEKNLVWGMFNGVKPPSFEELGGYNFDPRKMPSHEASRSNWKEYYHVYHKRMLDE
tara:strand:+ start:5692 stop:6594 length:903 start_codon:yes stop_codon:yes gene_type:complete